MTYQELLNGVSAFEAGQVPGNNGNNVVCFEFRGSWYPLKRIVGFATGNPSLTTNECLRELHSALPYSAVQEAPIVDDQAKPLTTEERQSAIRHLASRIMDLAQ